MTISKNKIFLLLSAILTGISQHNEIFGFIAWFSLIPLIKVSINCKNYKTLILNSFFWGFIYSATTVFWLAFNIGTNFYIATISMLATVLILSINAVLIFLLWFKFQKSFKKYSLYILAITWVCVEYIRSHGVLAFPWISLANTQTNFFYLIQNVEYVGIYGITFWVVLINILSYNFIQKKTKYNFGKLALIFVFPFISGYFIYLNLDEYITKDFKVSLIQPNINLYDKRDYSLSEDNLNKLIKKSKDAIYNGTDLIIWPESAMPFKSIQNKQTLSYIINNLFEDGPHYNNASLLTGNVIYQNNKTYNSSVLLNKDGLVNMYHKQQLVPMGEFVPLSNKIKILQSINLGQANFSSGIEDVIFEVEDKKFSSLICFESTFPEINRRHAKLGADFFVYLVNDGWYTSMPEPRQHAKQSIFRAIENRKTVVRCANTGISAIIAPSGEILQKIDLNKEGVINSFITKSNKITFYTLYGNVFVYLLFIILLGLFLISIYKNEKNI